MLTCSVGGADLSADRSIFGFHEQADTIAPQAATATAWLMIVLILRRAGCAADRTAEGKSGSMRLHMDPHGSADVIDT
jgi:hypothetical protein